MKVVHKVPKPVATKVHITLSSMEAGFLRRIMLEQKIEDGSNGFAKELFEALNDLLLSDYDARYPKWRTVNK